MAGIDQLKRIGPQHIKTTRRGAAHKRRIELVMIELVTQIPLAKHNRARSILRLIRWLNHARRIDRTRRGAAKLNRIAHVLRHLGRGMVHHQRHNAARAATGIHHALNARLVRTLTQHNQTSGFDDRGLLPRNGLKRVAQNACMVESNARNGDGQGIGRTRSIPTPAHADLKHGNIHRGLGKHYKCGSRQQVKRRDGIGTLPRRQAMSIHTTPRLNGSRNATGKRLVTHNAPINLHALGITHQLRRRIQRRLEPLATQDSSRETRRRSLTIRTGNLNAIEILIGTPQLIEHIDNRLEQRPSIPRNPPRISSKSHSLTKRKQIKLKRNGIQARTLRHFQNRHS